MPKFMIIFREKESGEAMKSRMSERQKITQKEPIFAVSTAHSFFHCLPLSRIIRLYHFIFIFALQA